VAVIECVPPVSVEIEQVAVLWAVPCVNVPEFVQVRAVPPSLKVTVPVGRTVPVAETPVTVAVKVTDCPKVEVGFTVFVTAIAGVNLLTVCMNGVEGPAGL